MIKIPLLTFALLLTLQPLAALAQDLTALTERAAQGDAEAQVRLGLIYFNGKDTPQDDTKAAEQGLALAQFKLGDIYNDGQGVPQDYSKTHMWWNLAAAQGNKGAIKTRDTVAKNDPRPNRQGTGSRAGLCGAGV